MFSRILVFFSFLLLPFVSFSALGMECVDAFIKGSRLSYEVAQSTLREKSKTLQPGHSDPTADRNLQRYWNEKPDTPPLLETFIPNGVHFLKYQQFEPSAPVVVKFDEPGSALIARAHYSYKNQSFATNVVFSTRAIWDNMKGEKNWLVGGEDAKAAILFLHGGGTRTTGAHVARTLISHFKDLQVDVLAIDLPWHNQGHRKYINFESEIESLGNFAKQFIPPDVPLFVWGHSYGSVYAEKLRMMTDRPHDKFLFHSNLKGVLIMSTAIDNAPGQPPAQKLLAYHKVRDDVQQNRLHEGAPIEHDALQNIVGDGKVGALPAFAESANLMQFNQVLPKHKGKHWIPGSMVVGIHDTLVYIGNEALYENYKLQENLETHYLDKLPHLSRSKDSPPEKVGHLVGDYLDPKSGKPVNLAIARKFIETQLKMDIVKEFIFLELRKSNIDISSKDKLREELSYLHSFEKIKKLFHENTIARQVEPEIIKKIQEFIDAQKQESILFPVSNPKDNMPDYIRVVQEFANNLAFRDFLRDYLLSEEKRTDSYKKFINRNMKITEEVVELMQPYSSPAGRVFTFLSQPALERTAELNMTLDILLNLKLSLDHFTQAHFAKKLNNDSLQRSLLELKDIFSSGEGSAQHLMRQKVHEIREQYKNTWPPQASSDNKKSSKKTPALVREILQSSENVDKALQVVQSERLPVKVEHQLTLLVKEYFLNKNIISDSFVPSMEDLRQIGIAPGKEKRAEKALRDISIIVQSMKNFSNSYLQIQKEEGQLKTRYEKMLTDVKGDIKKIKQALEKAPSSSPHSLKEEYQKSEEELDQVKLAHQEMEKALNKISVSLFETGRTLKESDVDNILHEQKPIIEDFSNLFSRYVQNRNLLRKKAITAIEKGEMGSVFQEAVTTLYGARSQGNHPVIGTKSQYLDLERIIEDLAKLEAKKLTTKKLLKEAKLEYKAKLASIVQFMNYPANTWDNMIVTLKESANTFNIVDVSADGVLKGQDLLMGRRRNAEEGLKGVSKAEVADYLDKEKNALTGVIKTWHGMKSSLPPLLPTE